MRRVTPEEVNAAYDKTGLKPVREQYVEVLNDGRLVGACGLSAVCIAEGNVPEEVAELDEYGHPEEQDWDGHTDDVFGRQYSRGFIAGFDRQIKPESIQFAAEIEIGYADGKAAAEVVFSK